MPRNREFNPSHDLTTDLKKWSAVTKSLEDEDGKGEHAIVVAEEIDGDKEEEKNPGIEEYEKLRDADSSEDRYAKMAAAAKVPEDYEFEESEYKISEGSNKEIYTGVEGETEKIGLRKASSFKENFQKGDKVYQDKRRQPSLKGKKERHGRFDAPL